MKNLAVLADPTAFRHPPCPTWCVEHYDESHLGHTRADFGHFRHHYGPDSRVTVRAPREPGSPWNLTQDMVFKLSRWDSEGVAGKPAIIGAESDCYSDDDRLSDMFTFPMDTASAKAMAEALLAAIAPAEASSGASEQHVDKIDGGSTVIAGLPGALTASFVMEALCSLQIPNLGDPAQIRLLADVARVGPNPGYEVEFELPRGVDAMAVCDRRSQLSAALRREPGTVYPSGGKHGQRHLVLYVADEPWLVDTLPDSATTTVAAFTDTLFDAVVGEVPTEVKVELWHEWNDWAETAVHLETAAGPTISADGAEQLGHALLTAAGQARAQRRTAPAEANADKIDGGSGTETCTRCGHDYHPDRSPSLIHCWQCDEAFQEEGR